MPFSRPLPVVALSALLAVPSDPPAARRAAPPRPPAVPAAPAAPAPVTLDSALLAGYRWRNVGPDRGGRSIAATGVKGRRDEAYFGATGGGLWKTVDGGESWAPVTDGQITSASVGAVAVSESNPDVVYIGTGETCIRGNIMPGDGVYRSTDAGRTWTHVGFRESHGIAKIRVHPTNPNVVFVASFGKYSAPNAERGVFKSADGGRTWRKVLFRDDRTGAIDLVIDRNDPNVLYAALWEAYRKEYQMSSGGPGSGLFKSTDGGETWTEITRAKGMPAGVVGRIGVAVSGADPKRVWALVENENGGLFRSDDAGASWTLVNAQRDVRQRAFYYTHVFADPKDRERVYLQNVSMFASKDGGKTITPVEGQTHGDYHDLWIDPDDPAHLVVANDGGGAVSTTRGARWTAQDFPTGQFYHAVTTAHVPYHICGSQQDNTTLCTPFDWNAAAFRQRLTRRAPAAGAPAGTAAARDGAARDSAARDSAARDTAYAELAAGGMAVSYQAGGGEPGYIAPDPRDPDVFYSGTNNGAYVDRFNRRLNTSREVNPYPWFYSGEPASEIRERWQWTFPIVFSKADPRLLFVSSQRLWATRDGGKTWLRLSGDLTRHAPETLGRSGGPITGDMNGPEVYATIFAVGPGKRDTSVIWTGSDDGLVHVTRDFGRTWANVTPPGMPAFGRVSQIDASAFESGRAYVSVRRPLLDDLAPYIFRTTDYGRTWTKITSGIRPDAYVHAVREDPTRRGMLYAATQHGVYVSYDDGARWQDLSRTLPDVPVADLIVEGNELVIGTHGRGFWVLDDVAALRQASPEVLAKDAHLFAPPPVVRSGSPVMLSWYARTAPKTARLDVLDSAGAVLRTYEPDTARADSAPRTASRRNAPTYLPTGAGLQRLAFDGRAQGIEAFPGMILWGAGTAGPALPPGRYTVRLTLDGRPLTAPLDVRRNPWLTDVTEADLRAQYAFGRQVRDRAAEANRLVIAVRRAKAQLDDRYKRAPNDSALKAAGERLRARASAVEERVYQVRNQSGQDPLNFPIRVNNRLANLLAMSERGDGRPTNNMPEILGILTAELKGHADQLAQVWRTDLPAVNRELTRLRLAPVEPGCANPAGCAARLE